MGVFTLYFCSAVTQIPLEAIFFHSLLQVEAICWRGRIVAVSPNCRINPTSCFCHSNLLPTWVVPKLHSCMLLTGCDCYFLSLYSYSLLGYSYFALTFNCFLDVQEDKKFPWMFRVHISKEELHNCMHSPVHDEYMKKVAKHPRTLSYGLFMASCYGYFAWVENQIGWNHMKLYNLEFY